MYGYNAGPHIAIPIYNTVLPYCVINTKLEWPICNLSPSSVMEIRSPIQCCRCTELINPTIVYSYIHVHVFIIIVSTTCTSFLQCYMNLICKEAKKVDIDKHFPHLPLTMFESHA